MATFRHNISGNLEVALIEPGDKVSNIQSILITNTSLTSNKQSTSVIVDLYIGTLSTSGVASKTYYLMRGKWMSNGDYIFLNHDFVGFPNETSSDFGLYIKLGNSSSTVDVLINRG